MSLPEENDNLVGHHRPMSHPTQISATPSQAKIVASASSSSSWRRRNCSSLGFLLAAFCLLLNCVFFLNLPKGIGFGRSGVERVTTHAPPRRLAVVVPAHSGDLHRALASLSRWPTKCSPVTLEHVELVLYYAEGPDDVNWSDEVVPALTRTGGRCFARTTAVFAKLTDEENVYPKGPSVQFYKMFLDEMVRPGFASFDAIAVVEWDVLVAHETSFERQYHAAFDAVEPFWVKGSTLAGTNFHGTAAIADKWHMLGHINGNAIYNNTDPAFVEFIEFTLVRWEYTYSYDVAIWATIADFPYSWPLWQRYSNKFVTTNLVANVGFLDVDKQTVSNAVESNTMFIHGSLTGGGGSQFLGGGGADTGKAKAAADALALSLAAECKSACGSPNEALATPGTSTVCDHTCAGSDGLEARFGGLSCGAGDSAKYGGHCRLCYVDVDEARKAEKLLVSHARQAGTGGGQHVIMCDTMRPPQSPSCSHECATKLDTVCDDRCGGGRFGDYNCNWRDRGPHCRFCFEDHEEAIVADKAAKRHGGRVIM